MAVALTDIFGTEINVYHQPRHVERQFAGFVGAHGVIAMHLGTRGRRLIVSGTLRATAVSYAAARFILQNAIDAIDVCQWADAADYSFCGVTLTMVVWDKFELVPDSDGKVFHWVVPGYWCTCKFIAHGRSLY